MDVSGKFSNRLNFDRGMPVRWLDLLRKSATLTFTVDVNHASYSVRERLLVDQSPDVSPERLPWARNASTNEWWVISSVDHRWTAVGYDEDAVSGVGEWITTVTADSDAGVRIDRLTRHTLCDTLYA